MTAQTPADPALEMTAAETRARWVAVVMEGRMATAAYLAPGLPPVDGSAVVAPPADSRDRHAVAGEIGGRE